MMADIARTKYGQKSVSMHRAPRPEHIAGILQQAFETGEGKLEFHRLVQRFTTAGGLKTYRT